jgi:hypothetical protein
MLNLDTTMIVAAFAAIVAFISAWFRRGEKLRKIEDAKKVEDEKNEIIQDIKRSVPSEFFIDRMLGRDLPTYPTTIRKKNNEGDM